MNKPALNDTLGGDTAVELTDVSKTFYQRQRSEKVRDVFKKNRMLYEAYGFAPDRMYTNLNMHKLPDES